MGREDLFDFCLWPLDIAGDDRGDLAGTGLTTLLQHIQDRCAGVVQQMAGPADGAEGRPDVAQAFDEATGNDRVTLQMGSALGRQRGPA